MEAKDKIQDSNEVSIRLKLCCETIGVETFAELIAKSDKELLKYRNFGYRSLAEVRDIRVTLSKEE